MENNQITLPDNSLVITKEGTVNLEQIPASDLANY